MIQSFSEKNFHQYCDDLCRKDLHLQNIVNLYGYPPMWNRPESFASIIHIILEQQVSLASAKAAFDKLQEKLGVISPEGLLKLSAEELRACYFSRQKALYARDLAEHLVEGKIDLKSLPEKLDEEIRITLKKVKGIGDWTVDIYLLFTLQRIDIFPLGDLAMVNSFRKVKKLKADSTREQLSEIAEDWRPLRSIATMLLWHHYLQERAIRF